MKAKVKTVSKVILEMDPKDAYLLKSYMQNKMDNESDNIGEFKESVFNALPPFNDLSILMNRMSDE